jgi:hypothetical protein
MKNICFILLFFISIKSLFSSVILEDVDKQKIPEIKYFNTNRELIRSFKYKHITVAEYLTDPLILYASLWGCFALTLPLWETNTGLSPEDTNYWSPYSDRGFDKLYDNKEIRYDKNLRMNVDDTFANRLKMEPFATGRVDPITKVWNNTITFRNDIFAKNIVEPIYFTYLSLYLRAKNYHPAIMITEVILLSLLYEITIRPFYMNASFEQFLKNPGVSIICGILLDELSTFLLTTPFTGLHILAYIFNPFNALPNSRVHPMLIFDPFKKAANLEAIIKL